MSKQNIILGGGCFWCTEAVFRQVPGIEFVECGYAGGTAETANYDSVCEGLSEHAEVIKITYDTQQIDFEEILNVFFLTHDPTTLNRQGNDIGSQYRSVIFYEGDRQRAIAEEKITQLKQFGVNVVTQLLPAPSFYRAEEYHQDFYTKNPTQGYCNAVIPPKIMKLKVFLKDKLGLSS